ncbi:Protein of unknown function, partial [Gryllus bimaculatus]
GAAWAWAAWPWGRDPRGARCRRPRSCCWPCWAPPPTPSCSPSSTGAPRCARPPTGSCCRWCWPTWCRRCAWRRCCWCRCSTGTLGRAGAGP